MSAGSGGNRMARHAGINEEIHRLKEVVSRLISLKNEIIGEASKNPDDTKVSQPSPPLSVFLETTAGELAKIGESIEFTTNEIRNAIF